MAIPFIVLSGHICSGKTSLSAVLADRYEMLHIRTSDYLKTLFSSRYPTEVPERLALQEFGEQLDKTTKGAWINDAIGRCLDTEDAHKQKLGIVIDSVRISEQIEAIRQKFSRHFVCHVHLVATPEVLRKRYDERSCDMPYETVMQNATEDRVDTLKDDADVVIDTSRCDVDDALVRIGGWLGLDGRNYARCVDVLVGGQYGSEGKGHIASHLAKEYDILLRVGGPNAGHTVYLDKCEKATFHHLPSGTLHNEEAKLIIGPGATLYVPTLMDEISKFKVNYERLSIDPQAMIISGQDMRAEAALQSTMGSTGKGVGSAASRRIMGRSGNHIESVQLAQDIEELRPFIKETYQELGKAFRSGQKIFLEGTQGAGLSLYHGSYPHVTSRDTTVAGCLAEAGISANRVRKVVMVCRTYPIRVENPPNGTSGYMKRELNWPEIAHRSGVSIEELRECEKTSSTNRERRVSEFDWVLLKKSASLNAPTDIALSFVDYIDIKNRDARRFEQLTEVTQLFIEEVERVACAPVSLVSTRFHKRGILDRRYW